MTHWHCEICDKTLKWSSKSKHLQSKRHLDRNRLVVVRVNPGEWHCETCNKTLKERNKSRHLHSKCHLAQTNRINRTNRIVRVKPGEWHCETCDKTLKVCHKSRHLRSKSHLNQTQQTQQTQQYQIPQECLVCCEFKPTTQFKKCNRCVYSWCKDCHRQMDKCPYCRKNFRNVRNRIPQSRVLSPEFMISREIALLLGIPV